MKSRTDKEIIEQTNNLAKDFYKVMGYNGIEGFRFYESSHPQERLCWILACKAQEKLTNTEIEDILDNLEEE